VLIDDYLPSFDVVERHRTKVLAPPSRVFTALRTTDFSSSRVTGVLLALRALPAALARGLGSRAPVRRRSARLDDFCDHGFAILDETPNEELLIGVVGRFWTPTGELVPTDARRFREPLAKGLAQGAWNFSIVPDGAGCVLRTETRVRCADAATRRRFRLYWFFIGAFSGLIRIEMLRAIRRTAERDDPSAAVER